MYRRDDEKLHYRDGEQAEHFSASQGAEQAGFSAQDGSEDVEDSCCRAGDVRQGHAGNLVLSLGIDIAHQMHPNPYNDIANIVGSKWWAMGACVIL